tara:strand:- start:576 stop:743 length:168 start_codon:yes stop_codon:yes gene_type:complete
MDLINNDKVDNKSEPPKDSFKHSAIKSMPFPARHKQIKKPKHKKAIAISDIQDKE